MNEVFYESMEADLRLLRPARALARWSAPNKHVFRLTRDDQVVAQSVPDAPGERAD